MEATDFKEVGELNMRKRKKKWLKKYLLDFKSKEEKYVFFGIIGIMLVLSGIVLFPAISGYLNNKMIESKLSKRTSLQPDSKTPQEYYQMFQCSCCGKPIDAGCCGMATQAKKYLDNLLLEGYEGDEVAYRMVKKFGFDILMDSSMEPEIREYIKSQAPENPPTIEIDNPKYDFGTISQKDGIATTEFTIRNTGGSDLIIENMDTSCMCTSASLIQDGKEGPRFSMSMHGDNPEDYELVIPPGETVQLKVYYDPMAHGKQKKPEARITREVTVISNDPVDFQKNVRIELIQVP